MKLAIELSAVLLLASMATAAYAGHNSTNSDRSSVASVLRANGFVAWEEIERDDGHWEVDNARHHSGRVYDLDIVGGRIVRRERERIDRTPDVTVEGQLGARRWRPPLPLSLVSRRNREALRPLPDARALR